MRAKMAAAGARAMHLFSRRTFIRGAGAVAFAGQTSSAWAAVGDGQCVSSYVPAQLTVDCATRRNYEQFRNYSDQVYLAGLVSLVNFKGKYGSYTAGSLFLFPVFRPASQQPKPPVVKGAPQKLPTVSGSIPTSALGSIARPPFPAGHNEESLLSVLGPAASARSQFLGFRLDLPADDGRAKLSRFTSGKLPDGKSVRIEWTVSNLNRPWFGGSPTIPHDDTCNGATWRKIIIAGLKQATVSRC
jgi:hypothetical protein